MHAFEDVWTDLIRYAEDSDSVGTVDDEYVTDVWYDEGDDAIRVEYDAPESLPRDAVRRVWEYVERDGELTMDDARDALGDRRGAAVVGLLNEGFGLPYDTDPVRVYSPSDRP